MLGSMAKNESHTLRQEEDQRAAAIREEFDHSLPPPDQKRRSAQGQARAPYESKRDEHSQQCKPIIASVVCFKCLTEAIS